MNVRTIAFTLVIAVFAIQVHAQNFIDARVVAADTRTSIAQAIAEAADGWVAWVVPAAGGRSSCCWNRDRQITCSLDGGLSSKPAPASRESDANRLIVMARADGEGRRVRMFGGDCPVDAGGETIHLLGNVPPETSLDWLTGELETRGKGHDLLAAMAMHEHATVVPRLIALARNDGNSDIRRNALFWLGQRAGEKAAAELRRAVDEDPEERVREHAVFAISQLPDERSVPMLIDLAKTHTSRGVRKKAMFWLAQKDDPRALDAIEAILQ